jgi:hypothetical protein
MSPSSTPRAFRPTHRIGQHLVIGEPSFRPTHRIGQHLVIGEPSPKSTPWAEFGELVADGAWRDDDGVVVPVVVHLDAFMSTIAAHREWIAERRALRVLLDGAGVPRVRGHLLEDGTGERARGLRIGSVEEPAGDLRLADLLAASRAVGGRLPIGICLAIARSIARAFAAVETIAPALCRHVEFDFLETGLAGDGTIACIGETRPRPDELVVIGRISYMAPELVQGHRYDARREMFTVGLLLFELVAGRHPLARQRDEGTVALLKAIAHGEIPSLLAEHPDTPLPIAQLVTRLTAREPRDRFDTWADVLAALDGARFCAHSGHAPPSSWRGHEPPPEQAARPVTQVSFDDAAAYAAFYEKALPTNDEWQRAIDAVGAARLAAGAVWEWTTTPMLHGHVVRGGRFRDRPKVPSDGQTSSWQDAAADDVGFRCVVRVAAAHQARPPG